MAYLPELRSGRQQRTYINTFTGLNQTDTCGDGETFDEEGLTGDRWPQMATRKKISLVQQLTLPGGILGKDALFWIDGTKCYYNGLEVSGLTVTAVEDGKMKQIISMGAYICIFPDKKYLNTANLTDHGSMDAHWAAGTTLAPVDVTIQMCRLDGTSYASTGDVITVGTEPPAEPDNGALWIDSSGSTHILMQYSAPTESWQQVATTYVRIGGTNLGKDFADYDTVTVAGIRTAAEAAGVTDAALLDQLGMLSGDMIVYRAGADYIVVAGIVDQSVTVSGGVTIDRDMPSLDFVTECNNRLWGCKYGMVNGQAINEIYACKLGDFKNWRSFMGLASDSYTVSVGSDGKFTGACTLRGAPYFFKENCYHRIGGSIPANFTMTTTLCRGVQEGSEKSLAIVNETLYYKSRTDVMAFDGSLPQSVSVPLGKALRHSAVAGAIGGKYYIWMLPDAYVYSWDTVRGVWHKEWYGNVKQFAAMDDSLYAVSYLSITNPDYDPEAEESEEIIDSDVIIDFAGIDGTAYTYDTLPWEAVFGWVGYETEARKYLSRFNLRMELEEGTEVSLLMHYDTEPEDPWDSTYQVATITGTGGTRTYMIPVIPRRCDRCRLLMTGHGGFRMISLARLYEEGSDG